jgi:hypothetical protein
VPGSVADSHEDTKRTKGVLNTRKFGVVVNLGWRASRADSFLKERGGIAQDEQHHRALRVFV